MANEPYLLLINPTFLLKAVKSQLPWITTNFYKMTIYSLLLRTDIGVSSGIVEAELLLDVAFDARNEP